MRFKKLQTTTLLELIDNINNLLENREYSKACGLKVIFELAFIWHRLSAELPATINLFGHKSFAPRVVNIKILYQITIFFCVIKKYSEFMYFHPVMFENSSEYVAFIE